MGAVVCCMDRQKKEKKKRTKKARLQNASFNAPYP